MPIWQPIDTAPNRTPVLVSSTTYGIVIAYRTGDVWSRDLGYASDTDEAFYIDRARDVGITHWMPLPAPP